MKAVFPSLSLLLLPLLLAANPYPEEPVARAQAIIDEAERRASGFGDLQAVAEMVIRNGRGSEAVRELSISILDLPGSASRSLTVVDEPKDVRGTALLTHTDEAGQSEQWLFLPALNRVKRIAASGRSGPFMGSEFSYEDFSAQAPENYDFRWLRDEPCNGVPCHVLERRPKATTASAYARQEVWMDAEHLRLQQVHYFDTQDAHVKTLTATGYQRYQDRWWRAEQLRMLNERSGAETLLRWSEIRMDQGLGERDFDLNALKAAR